jgi:hypothetical protein
MKIRELEQQVVADYQEASPFFITPFLPKKLALRL